MKKKSTSSSEFILNEPVQRIKNGNTRKSVKVSSKQFPARTRREKINKILMWHDLHNPPNVKFTSEDIALLRQIALESSTTNNIPNLRYNAIIKLASFPTIETLNTLTYLAKQGEDYYVRSHAVLALSETGLELAAPIVLQALNDEHPLIRSAAEKAVVRLIQLAGIGRIQQFYVPDMAVDEKRIADILERFSKQAKQTRPRINKTERDEDKER